MRISLLSLILVAITLIYFWHINSVNAFQIVAPSDLPPGAVRQPIILVPGITVSQNKKLMYRDEEGGEWKFAPFFNVYKGLINKLESAGYEQDQDLFIAHYDWRYGAEHNAEHYLKPMIEAAKSKTGSYTVDLVAHSFGGIVSRAYIQGDDYDYDVDQLITIGSPHEGSADSYVAWEGGLFPQGWGYWISGRIEQVEETLKTTRNQPDIQRPESFRAFFPSLKDMLPINSFIKKDGALQSPTLLTAQNDFLKTAQDNLSNISDKFVRLTTIAGTSLDTLANISLLNTRTAEDEELNRWRDGHAVTVPPPLDSDEGDGRVLYNDAVIGEDVITVSGIAHHKLPDAVQDDVFTKLGLAPQASFWSTFPERIFSIVILSPLQAEIVGPSGQILSVSQNDFGSDYADYDDDPNDPDDPIEINLADMPIGNYQINYTGTGTGEYTVITSYADENELETDSFSGTATPGQILTSSFSITAASANNFDIVQPDTSLEPSPSTSSSGRGDERDCCPGPDPTPIPTSQPKVLSARTIASPYRHLVPLINHLHRLAYNRHPTYDEHIYWWDRVLKGDFMRADQLLGAMQWHALPRH